MDIGCLKCSIIIIIMKNFNRRKSHGHHGSRRRTQTDAHLHGSHAAFTHTLTSTQLQPLCTKCQLNSYFSVHAGSFRVSVIHQTLTWTTGSLTCICDHSCDVYVHTEVGHTDSESEHFLLWKTHKFFLCSWRDLNLHPPTLYQLSHPTKTLFRILTLLAKPPWNSTKSGLYNKTLKQIAVQYLHVNSTTYQMNYTYGKNIWPK